MTITPKSSHASLLFEIRKCDEVRLREVCEELLGPPVVAANNAQSSDESIVAWKPVKLVRDLTLPWPSDLDLSFFPAASRDWIVEDF